MKILLKSIISLFMILFLATSSSAEKKSPNKDVQNTSKKSINFNLLIIGKWQNLQSESTSTLVADGSYFSISKDQKYSKQGTYSISNNKLSIQGTKFKSTGKDWSAWNVVLSFTVIYINNNEISLLADDGTKTNYIRMKDNIKEQSSKKESQG